MTGLCPTGTVARTWPKPTASMGLVGSQLGLVGSAATEQSGMLMMLTEPGEVPLPALATTSSAIGWRKVCPDGRYTDGNGGGGRCRAGWSAS